MQFQAAKELVRHTKVFLVGLGSGFFLALPLHIKAMLGVLFYFFWSFYDFFFSFTFNVYQRINEA